MHKVCTKCGIDKPLSAFCSRKGVPDGRTSWCRECYRVYNTSDRRQQKEYQQTDRAKELRADYQQRNLPAHSAHQKVYVALQAGELTQLPCEVCDSSNSEAHHEDYSKPLEVSWLCREHHQDLHRSASH